METEEMRIERQKENQARNLLCKDCGEDYKQNGSSRCKRCSDDYKNRAHLGND